MPVTDQPYVGEIRMFAGNFGPAGWALCNGQLLPISENETLFQLLGTTYGGDGQETFAVPDLRGRLPMHQYPTGVSPHSMGEKGGVEQVTLTANQIPSHTHAMTVSSQAGTQSSPQGAMLAAGANLSVFRPGTANQAMAADAIAPAGGSQPHENMQPFLCVNFIISLFGVFPTQD